VSHTEGGVVGNGRGAIGSGFYKNGTVLYAVGNRCRASGSFPGGIVSLSTTGEERSEALDERPVIE
jgi:hypothetical protein